MLTSLTAVLTCLVFSSFGVLVFFGFSRAGLNAWVFERGWGGCECVTIKGSERVLGMCVPTPLPPPPPFHRLDPVRGGGGGEGINPCPCPRR